MEIWQAVILGLVEGITEYLPISSTGHLILASWLMGLDDPSTKQAVDDFNIVVQGGAILAVVGLYWPSVLRMIKGVLGKDNGGFAMLVNLVIAFIPAAVVGLLAKDWIEEKLFWSGPVLGAVLVGAVVMLLVEARHRGRIGPPRHSAAFRTIEQVRPVDALLIGVLQCAALWPGMSRSMVCILGGYAVGLRPRAAAEFSFLLGLPTLTAACVYSLAKNLARSHRDGTPNLFEALGLAPVIVGVVVATVSAAVAVRWLVGFLSRRGLTPFAWYRVGLFVVLALVLGLSPARVEVRASENESVPQAGLAGDR
ncbi:MAG: undecaprenyl-diphosphatase [Phycisphaerae bacterium]|nr:Undecaprenyl-diphosphatase [Phycisphaerales bacterium]